MASQPYTSAPPTGPRPMDVPRLVLGDLLHLLLEIVRGLRFVLALPRMIRAEATRREGLGYVVWGVALVLFAVPEIWAAADSYQPWPTLSSTVGGIEKHHDWAAVIVVAVMVFGLLHATRLKPSAAAAPVAAPGTPEAALTAALKTAVNPARELLATPDGRLTQAETVTYMGWITYYVVAIAAVAAGYLVPRLVASSDKQLIGESLYGSMGLVLFVLPSWLSYRVGQVVPFPPLFETFRNIEARAKWLAVVVAAGLTILMIHLAFYPWTGILPSLQHLNSYCNNNPAALCQK